MAGISVGGVVEHVVRPGPINTAEENVAVESLARAVFSGNNERMLFDHSHCGGGAFYEGTRDYMNLTAFRPEILCARMKKATKIVQFDAVIINEVDMLDAYRC